MKRVVLLRTVKAMLALLVLAFVWVFISGIGGISEDRKGPAQTNLQPGQAIIRTIDGQRRWLIWPSEQQLQRAVSIDEHLWNPASSCLKQGQCQLVGSTSRAGIDISFSETRPAQLPPEMPWYGGFVDPVSGVVYDRLGRAYILAGDGPQENMRAVTP